MEERELSVEPVVTLEPFVRVDVEGPGHDVVDWAPFSRPRADIRALSIGDERVGDLGALSFALERADTDMVDVIVHTRQLEEWLAGDLAEHGLAREVASLRAFGACGKTLRAVLFNLVEARRRTMRG